MIKINCETKDSLKLAEMIPFQGNLKKRTPQDLAGLKESLTTEGLMMPFAVWKHEGKNYLLDGHGRKEALMQMAINGDAEMISFDWPVVFVEADTEEAARKALLQITSSYGKITKQGVKQFCVSIPDYRAPAIQKYVAKPVKVNTDAGKLPNTPVKKIIRIRVSQENEAQLLNVLGQFKEFIEIL